MTIVVTSAPAETEAVGRRLGEALVEGDVVALCGDLGAGKTCLVRGLAAGVGADPETVCSPTFVLHHVYRGRRLTLHHVDLFRLGRDADLAVLDLEGLVAGGAVAIEWAELAPPQLLQRLSAVTLRLVADDEVPTRRRLGLAPSAPARLRRAFVGTG